MVCCSVVCNGLVVAYFQIGLVLATSFYVFKGVIEVVTVSFSLASPLRILDMCAMSVELTL